jgi:hypothetical protein
VRLSAFLYSGERELGKAWEGKWAGIGQPVTVGTELALGRTGSPWVSEGPARV